MRQTASHLAMRAFVAALRVAPRINVGTFLNRGWVIPPNVLF